MRRLVFVLAAVVAVGLPRAAAGLEEDESGWDCARDGNRVCASGLTDWESAVWWSR